MRFNYVHSRANCLLAEWEGNRCGRKARQMRKLLDTAVASSCSYIQQQSKLNAGNRNGPSWNSHLIQLQWFIILNVKSSFCFYGASHHPSARLNVRRKHLNLPAFIASPTSSHQHIAITPRCKPDQMEINTNLMIATNGSELKLII